MNEPEKTKRYRFSPKAETDYLAILDYIANKLMNPDAAEKFRDDLRKAIHLMCDFPEFHPKEMSIKYEFRKMIVGSYLVFYVILEKEIVIARILNSRQNHSRILEQARLLCYRTEE